MSNFSYVINEITDDLELKATNNSSPCDDVQMKKRLTINKHYNSSMAKLAVDKNKDIESLQQIFLCNFYYFLRF